MVGWTSMLRHTLLAISGPTHMLHSGGESRDKCRLLLCLTHHLRGGGQMFPTQIQAQCPLISLNLCSTHESCCFREELPGAECSDPRRNLPEVKSPSLEPGICALAGLENSRSVPITLGLLSTQGAYLLEFIFSQNYSHTAESPSQDYTWSLSDIFPIATTKYLPKTT